MCAEKVKCQFCEKIFSQRLLPKHKCVKKSQADSLQMELIGNNGTISVGRVFPSKTYLPTKKLFMENMEKIVDGESFFLTRCPAQYCELNIEEEIRQIGEYEGKNINFDDMSDNNQKAIDLFFLKRNRIRIQINNFYPHTFLIYQ